MQINRGRERPMYRLNFLLLLQNLHGYDSNDDVPTPRVGQLLSMLKRIKGTLHEIYFLSCEQYHLHGFLVFQAQH